MAYSNSTTPRPRSHLARINPSWTPATGDLGPLAKFFKRPESGAVTRPSHAPRPLPVSGAQMEIA